LAGLRPGDRDRLGGRLHHDSLPLSRERRIERPLHDDACNRVATVGVTVSRPPGHPISLAEFEADVRAGLNKPGQKELYSKYLYDDLGSALFEAITLLPEYGLTRADLRLLETHASLLPEHCVSLSTVVELGSGSGEKARRILPHLLKCGPI